MIYTAFPHTNRRSVDKGRHNSHDEYVGAAWRGDTFK